MFLWCYLWWPSVLPGSQSVSVLCKDLLNLEPSIVRYWLSVVEAGCSLLCSYFYPLCYTVAILHAVLLKFTYYAQYYAHEQELLLYYYASAIHTQFSMNNLLHVVDNF